MFTAALGLGGDWEVSAFEFKVAEQEMHIRIRHVRSIRRVGIDETSRRRRHRYITIFMDFETRRVVFIAKGKGGAVIAEFATLLRRHGTVMAPIRSRFALLAMTGLFLRTMSEACTPSHDRVECQSRD